MSSTSTTSQPGSGPALDPNLKCRGCEKQFRDGEIQLYKQHSSKCDKLKLLERHVSPVDDDIMYHEDINTEEQELDPNLTCIGCRMVFRERQIQEYKRHCNSCSIFQERRNRTQSSPGSKTMADNTDSRNRSNTET